MKFLKKIFKKEWEEAKSFYGEKKPPAKSPSKTTTKKINDDVEIVFYEPKSTTDIRKVAKDIIKGKTTSVNFHKFNKKTTEKYLQFLGGVIFTIDGAFHKRDEFEYFFSASKTIIANMKEK